MIGTAGWSLPKAYAPHFPGDGSHLERYAQRLSAVEINTSFYRPHRVATYEKWAAAVPAGFRFAVKVPRAITHERRLTDVDEVLARFLGEVAGLGSKLGPLLLQLPPSLAFDCASAARFLATFRRCFAGDIVCEPRHATWFTQDVDKVLCDHAIARVAADPAPVREAGRPGVGWISPITGSMAPHACTVRPMSRPFSPGSPSACTRRQSKDVARGVSSTTPRSSRPLGMLSRHLRSPHGASLTSHQP